MKDGGQRIGSLWLFGFWVLLSGGTQGDTIEGDLPSGVLVNTEGIGKELIHFGSNLPLVVVRAKKEISRAILSHDVEAQFFDQQGGVSVVKLATLPGVAVPSELKFRGSSSRKWRKPSFRLESQNREGKEISILPLGLPAGSDWILSGRYEFDRSLIRNDLIYRLSRELGQYAPRTKLVELFLEMYGSSKLSYRHNYCGVYSFTEKIERGKYRVNIPKRDRNHPKSGGYIFKLDNLAPGELGFEVNGFGKLGWVYPKEDKVGGGEIRAVQEFLEDFQSDLSEKKPFSSFREKIDVDSWLVYHWLNLFSKNGDGLIASSFFHLKPKNKGWMLAAGPVWDFDRTMGSNDGKDVNPEGWNGDGGSSRYWGDRRAPIWGMLLADSDFRQLHIDFWQKHRKGALSWRNIDSIILEMTAELNRTGDTTLNRQGQKSPAARNFAKWKERPPRGGSHLAEIEILRSWIQDRLKWIDSQFTTPPVFSEPSGKVKIDTVIELAHRADEVHYTLDGSDPRAVGGKVSANAFSGKSITLKESVVITTRSRTGTGITSWSAPVTASYVVVKPK